MEIEFISRQCKNCTFYPCYKLTNINIDVCDNHRYEHEKLEKQIDKKIKE